MQHEQLKRWQHSHSFGQDLKRPGESRTPLVDANLPRHQRVLLSSFLIKSAKA